MRLDEVSGESGLGGAHSGINERVRALNEYAFGVHDPEMKHDLSIYWLCEKVTSA